MPLTIKQEIEALKNEIKDLKIVVDHQDRLIKASLKKTKRIQNNMKRGNK